MQISLSNFREFVHKNNYIIKLSHLIQNDKPLIKYTSFPRFFVKFLE